VVTLLPVLGWISDGNSKWRQSNEAVAGSGREPEDSHRPTYCSGQGIPIEMKWKQGRCGVLQRPPYSGAKAGED